MIRYEITLKPKALDDLKKLKKSGKKIALKKIEKLLGELEEHPTTGTGQVEQLKGDLTGYWSRRIDKKNRLVYSIEDEIVTVVVISAMGHYGDR